MISTLLLTGLLLQEAPPVRPPYPQRTESRLYETIGACNADLWDMREYVKRLADALDAKDKEIAELKKKAEEPKPDPKK